MLNTNASDAHTAEAFCTARGAHLVAYASLEEQTEVGVCVGHTRAAVPTGCCRQMLVHSGAWRQVSLNRMYQ